MPTISIPDFTDASLSNPEDLMNRFQMLSKALSYLMSHLDENNVTRIITDVTEIKSAKGETVIDGPQIKMFDTPAQDEFDQRNFSSTGQLRIELGYDAGSSDFVFEMYSKAGLNTLNLDSEGEFQWNGSFTFQDRTDENLAVMTFSNLGDGLGFQILSMNGANLEVGAGPGGILNIGGHVEFLAPIVAFEGSAVDFTSAGSVAGLVTTVAGDPPHSHTVILNP